MPWFAVYEVATGTLRSQGSVVADVLPDGWASKEFSDRPADGMEWNPETLEFDIAIPVVHVWERTDLMRLFSVGEHAAILSAEASDLILRVAMDRLRSARTIRSDDLEVQYFLGYCVEQGYIAADRPAQILSNHPPQGV